MTAITEAKAAGRPGFLLADDVGLGKTIEAGLILKELRARGGAERVLVVAPPNPKIPSNSFPRGSEPVLSVPMERTK